ncbi:MAG: hypothetical protein PUC88_00395 [Clostridia bacterium]|nr:hypothetical protein [Clostridia bacterium]
MVMRIRFGSLDLPRLINYNEIADKSIKTRKKEAKIPWHQKNKS